MSLEYTFSSIKGKQWGKIIYSTNISFAQIGEICRIDEEVQRRADKKRMEEIAGYILDALIGKRFMAGFNSIVTSLRYANPQYEDDKKVIRVSTMGKLYVSDGQHRLGGIKIALERILSNLDEAREENDHDGMRYWEELLQQFEELTIPVVIFIKLTKDEEKQLFHDLNNLSASVTQTQALNFDQTDPYNRLSKELENEIPLIKKYGIEKTSKQLSDKRREVATLATWNIANRILLNGNTNADKHWNKDWNYEDKKLVAKDFWSALLEVLPEDYTDKTKYLITKSSVIQGLAAWGHKLIFEDENLSWKSIVHQLRNFDWGYSNDIYARYGGGALSQKNGVMRFYFKGTRAAIKSIPLALDDYLTKPVNK